MRNNIAMKYGRTTFCLYLFAIIAVIVGCDRGPKQYEITGNVSYQGQPVIVGEIILEDLSGVEPTSFSVIENGHYELWTTAGEKRVRITASVETGKMIEGAMDVSYPERVDLIPPQYNTATTLLRTVDPQGDQSIDFHLD